MSWDEAITTWWHKIQPAKASSEADLLAIWAPLLASGLSITESITLLAESAEHRADRARFTELLQGIQSGKPLGTAMAGCHTPWSDSLCEAMHCAERSGQLADMLSLAADAQYTRQRIRDKAWAAARYPLIVGALAVVIIVGMVIGIVPKFESLYRRMGSDLPQSTALLMGASQLLTGQGLWLLLGLVVLILLSQWILQTPWGKRWIDQGLTALPVIGRFRRLIQTQTALAHLELLIRAGVSLPNALLAAGRMSGSPRLREQCQKSALGIRGGRRSDHAIQSISFNPLAHKLWSLGVRSGRLPDFLSIGHRAMSQRLESELSTLTSVLEPLLMAALGLVTGAVMLALYQPIFSLGDVL